MLAWRICGFDYTQIGTGHASLFEVCATAQLLGTGDSQYTGQNNAKKNLRKSRERNVLSSAAFKG